MGKRLIDILCCTAILLLLAYQYILAAIMWVAVTLANHAAEAGGWLGRYRGEKLQKGG